MEPIHEFKHKGYHIEFFKETRTVSDSDLSTHRKFYTFVDGHPSEDFPSHSSTDEWEKTVKNIMDSYPLRYPEKQ